MSVLVEAQSAVAELVGDGGGGDAAAAAVDAVAELAVAAAALRNEIHRLLWTASVYSPRAKVKEH